MKKHRITRLTAGPGMLALALSLLIMVACGGGGNAYGGDR